VAIAISRLKKHSHLDGTPSVVGKPVVQTWPENDRDIQENSFVLEMDHPWIWIRVTSFVSQFAPFFIIIRHLINNFRFV
jgi:hypothetical protein